MVRLDHLTIPVTDLAQSRAWYTGNLGMKVEFEIPERKTTALQDDADLTLFLVEARAAPLAPAITLTFQVDNVDVKHRDLSARGVVFEKSPRKHLWGYGAELRDPDGYLVYLWDEKSMREKGGG